MQQAPATNSHAESPAHEADAMSVRGITWFVIWFVIANGIVLLLVWLMYIGLLHGQKKSDVVNSALAGREHPPPPEPRLQPSPSHENLPSDDLAIIRRHEDAEFARRGWLDPKTARFAIPQDVAERDAQLSAPAGGAK